MLVCNVSPRPLRRALIDDSASATDTLDASVGVVVIAAAVVEAMTALDTIPVSAVMGAVVGEAATATDTPDAALAGVSLATYDGLATNVTVSNGGRTALHHNTTTNSGVISTAFESTGKYYFEVTLQTSTTASNFAGIMISSWASVFSSSQMTTLSTSVQFGASGTIYSNGASTAAVVGATAVGDIYSFAIDLTGHLAWVRKNGGNWNGSGTANPATGVGGVTIATGSFAPIVRFAAGAVATDQMTGNFGQAAFVYTAPSGFGNWPA